MRRWSRGFLIALRLFPFVVAFIRDRRRWLLFGRPRRLAEERHRRRAAKLTATIAKLGPTFIKLAQVFGARADILPEPYLSAIASLQDRVPPDAPEAIERVIAQELGQPADQVFESFAREPVAAASLGQVHRARIGGRDLAVKVLRPGVEAVVALDLDVSFRILFILNILFRNHHVKALTNVVREFSVRVRVEMDFREEARHMALFQAHFGDDGRVVIPAVVESMVRRRVLVMEWVDGERIDRLAPRFATGELRFRDLMETLTEIYLRMLLVEGVLHADPHPGNLLVDARGRIVFLDWGMVVQLRPPTRDTIIRVALAAAREDVDGIINGMYELGMIDPDISRAEIRDAAAEILAIIERARGLGQQRVQELVAEIMDTFYTWPLMLPRELVYFFRAAALLEGIGFRYDPAFNGLDVSRAVVGRMKPELLRVAARQPAEIARNVFDDARSVIFGVRDIVQRLDREELRVRVHPRDLMQIERFLSLQVRRIQLSLFAATMALITAIVFIAVPNWWVLAGGLIAAFILFMIVLLLPTHLLENPMRHARGMGR
ncbi:MAG TPA: AarF/UbiB family protein [Longimicrobiales bacterium]|nr:AarF/UbiB family protein [Longimicrobiales bacterium]